MQKEDSQAIPRLARDFFTEAAGALIKTTLVDFPGRVASSFFLKGCNLRCPYCYNWALVDSSLAESTGDEKSDSGNLASLEEVFAHLEKRRNVLTGFVISGGEPLLFPHLAPLIEKAKSYGYKIKLDTNGTLPDRLEAIIKNPATAPDFIAMDIKTSPARYGLVAPHATQQTVSEMIDNLGRSIQIISRLPADSREWRTVLVPPLVGKKDIAEIAKILPADAVWQFAQFRNENCLDANYNGIAPYTDKETSDLVAYAKTMISGANLR